MYAKEFDAALKNRKIRGVFFYGDEILMEIYAQKFIQKIRESADNCELMTFFPDEILIPQICEILGSGSLFGEKKLLHLKIAAKISKKDLQALQNALFTGENFLAISFLPGVVSYFSDCRAMSTAFNKTECVFVRFFAPDPEKSLEILKNKAEELAIDIDDAAIIEIFQTQGLALAVNELTKYKIFDEKITTEHVSQLNFGLKTADFEAFLDAFFDKNQNILAAYQQISAQNDDVTLIFRLEQYFFTLFLLHAQAKISGKNDMRETLGFTPPKHVETQYLSRSLELNLRIFEEIFLLFCDLKFLQYRGDKTIFLQTLIKIKKLL